MICSSSFNELPNDPFCLSNLGIEVVVFTLQIWHDNVPYNKIANRKVFRGLMKKEGSHITFSDGGAMFPDGAKQYIEKLKQYIPMAGGVLRTVLDMGSGV